MKRVIFKIATAVVSVAMALVTVEVLGAVLGIGRLEEDYTGEEIMVHHEVLGLYHRRGHVARFRRPVDGIDTAVTTDELGLRVNGERPQAEDAEASLLVLGDSLTMGYGVADGETFCARLEERFLDAGKKVRVYNGGVASYGPDQSLLLLRMLKEEIEPDAVLYMFCRNDVSDILTIKAGGPWKATKPVFALAGGGMELLNSPPELRRPGDYAYVRPAGEGYVIDEGRPRFFGLRAWLHEHSMVFRNAKKAAVRFSRRTPGILDADLEGKAGDAVTLDYQRRLLGRLIAEMRGDSKRFFVAAALRDAGPGADDPGAMVAEICEGREIPFFDVSPSLGDPGEYRFENDPHWTRKGHRRVAESLFRHLEKESFP